MRRLLLAGVIVATGLVGLVPAGTAAADPVCGPPPWQEPTTIIGTQGNDRLVGDVCQNIIVGLAGRDRLIGRAEVDVLRGGRDRDVLRGVDGYADNLNAGAGRDRCVGDQLDTFRRCDTIVIVHVTPA